jgi:hypothetical protein
MAKSLIDTIDSTPFQGLSVTNVHTGFNVSIEFERDQWSPPVFGTSPSDAILKAVRLHAPKRRDGACACAMDGLRCALGASQKRRLAPLPPLPDLTPPALPPLPY